MHTECQSRNFMVSIFLKTLPTGEVGAAVYFMIGHLSNVKKALQTAEQLSLMQAAASG